MAVTAALTAAPTLAGCSSSQGRENLDKLVAVDGSSTVYPISEAVAEEFQRRHAARVTIGVSGTGGGFKKFCAGETAITGASRPITAVEIAACERGGVEFIELPVAYDGIAVAVHPANDWARVMTVAELARLWEPGAQGKIVKWSQIRAGWPELDVHLFGPGVDSGTYDYFTQAVVGRAHASRGDFTSSENDHVLVQGVVNDRLGLGFFGYAYYAAHQDELALVQIDDGDAQNGAGPIAPSPATIADGSYSPLTRPVFIYVSVAAAKREAVADFVEFYLARGGQLATEVGYVPLPEPVYARARERFAARTTGSMFEGGALLGTPSVLSTLAGFAVDQPFEGGS